MLPARCCRTPRDYATPRQPPIEALEDRRLLSAGASDPLQVLVGLGAAKSVIFTDVSGTQATIQVAGPGSASVMLNGTGLSQLATARGIVVNGSGITLGTITLSGTTAATTLLVLTHGKGSLISGSISASGAMAGIRAPGMVVSGDITAGPVHQIQLAGAQGGDISLSASRGGGGPLVASLGNVANVNLTCGTRIDSLAVGQWINTTGDALMIQAPQIVSIQAAGSFAPSLSVSGAGSALSLSRFKAGTISGGTWNVGGNTGTIEAGNATGWTAAFGTVKSISVAHDAQADISASIIDSVSVRGNLSNSTLTLTTPLMATGFDLTRLTVGGDILASTIRAAGSIGAVSASRMQDSRVYAGMNLPPGQALPAVIGDFASVAQIQSLTLRKSASASLANSDVAAYSIGAASLGTVPMANGGTPFGLGAHQIKLVSFTDQATGKTIRIANPASTASVNSALTAKGITPQDFVVNIV